MKTHKSQSRVIGIDFSHIGQSPIRYPSNIELVAETCCGSFGIVIVGTIRLRSFAIPMLRSLILMGRSDILPIRLEYAVSRMFVFRYEFRERRASIGIIGIVRVNYVISYGQVFVIVSVVSRLQSLGFASPLTCGAVEFPSLPGSTLNVASKETVGSLEIVRIRILSASGNIG